MVRAWPTWPMRPSADTSSVGGMEILRPPRVESFFMLSLPEISGTP